ncbi:NADP-dependent malic enzyme, partial [Tyrophagus putrescentiae]
MVVKMCSSISVKYQERYCTFNHHDIQGTASVAVAGVLASLKVTASKQADLKVLFLGAGEAALGIADFLVMAVNEEGLSTVDARSRIFLIDSQGLVTSDRPRGDAHKDCYAARLKAEAMPPTKDLLAIIEKLRPNVLIRAAAQPSGTFSALVLAKMAEIKPFRHRYRPSMHCISRWNRRQQRWQNHWSPNSIDEEEEGETEDEDSFDVDTLLERAEERRRRQKVTSPSAGADHWPPFGRCHYLSPRTVDELCHADRKGVRARLLGSLTLRSCRRFAVDRALSPELYRAVVNHTDCGRILRELLVLDDLVEKLACEFEAILMRYDCAAEWSRWRCEDCQ